MELNKAFTGKLSCMAKVNAPRETPTVPACFAGSGTSPLRGHSFECAARRQEGVGLVRADMASERSERDAVHFG
jgi:hypothetical protein